ncbi:MAG: RagB/SusD family nutrient uptake outer membrane protein [Bacteroidales bacterium]|jgi:hypothetical protein|nr:RagB/SusD family nutrient uptake outer membrane protein [Bacteroidales bacterium]
MNTYRHQQIKKYSFFKVLLLAAIVGFNACSDYLDVVPEGVATIDMAFNSRVQALKYLATCYSYMPKQGNPSQDPAILGSDEMWTVEDISSGFTYDAHYIARGMMNATDPLLESWGSMYQALRDCNTFLDNVAKVPDLLPGEHEQWVAEIKVLKAYYHFHLLRMYGPIPLVRENLPVSVDVSKVKVEREPVDNCFGYIVQLLDEASEGDHLPLFIYDPANDMGRITRPIALALKATVLVTAASPLFNGNNDQATLRNRDGTQLFNTTYDPGKWEKAVTACKEAIEICHEAGIELYKYPSTGIRYTDTITTQLSLRNAFSQRWNSEIIWANTQSTAHTSGGGMLMVSAPILNQSYTTSTNVRRSLGMPLKIASMFYTHYGVPLDEDKTRNIDDIYNLRVAQPEDKLYIKEGRTTIDLHFNREPRFYAWVGFDGGVWFGAGQYNDKNPSGLWYLGLKIGEVDGTKGKGPYTGYIPKKYLPFEGQMVSVSQYSATAYPWPIIRLSDLYLLYAEAINEFEGPAGSNSSEMFEYIDRVRARAGLKTVKESWDTYTNNPKYNNQTGMRQIIQQERMIELSFEGHRFWDIRRWKIAPELYRTPIEGWNMQVAVTDGSESEVNQIMYTPRVLLNRDFRVRDYFWPIKNSDIINNRNLVQNIGW